MLWRYINGPVYYYYYYYRLTSNSLPVINCSVFNSQTCYLKTLNFITPNKSKKYSPVMELKSRPISVICIKKLNNNENVGWSIWE